MIFIIGAGPVGCYTAYLLAKEGADVFVFEEHSSIGQPVQCTGIITDSIKGMISLDPETISNRAGTARVYSRSNFFEAPINDIILDRPKFDKGLAELAQGQGARMFLNHKFIRLDDGKIVFKNLMNSALVEYPFEEGKDKLIGADGPNSRVRELINGKNKVKFLVGMQAVAKFHTDNNVEVFLGSIAPGGFGWVVPENKNTVRIGLMAKKNPRIYFDKLLGIKGIMSKNVVEIQAGLIPVYNPRLKTQMGSIYIVGDAAGQVKATTGGGIIPGLKAAECLAESIIYGNDYEHIWKTRIGAGLWIHLNLRHILDRFSDEDYIRLVKLCGQDKIKRIFRHHNRDKPFKLLLSIILREPRFLALLC